MFLKKILLIFETIKELRYLSQNEPSDLEGEISIATTHSILQYYLPQVISDFKKNHPKIRIRISGSFNHEILRKLDLSDADFGLCSPVSSHTSYTCLKLFETKFALIVNKNENLPFKKEAITLDQISKKTFIHYNRDSFLRKIIESKFIERGLHIQIPIEVNHFETIKRYVELGLGISIINSICLSQTDISRFKIIPMDEFFAKRTYYLIFRKGKYISPPASKLIQLITSTT
jgi:DNA-binding transcriptional LysR family regulator